MKRRIRTKKQRGDCTMSNTAIRKELFDLILRDAVVKKKVVLASGKESTMYVDIRKVSLHPQGGALIAQMMWDAIVVDKPTAVGGPTIGADPIIGALLYHSHLQKNPIKGFIIRSAQKKHGMMNLIEGPVLEKGSSVILVDDVITTGGSLKTSIEIVEQAGIQVKRILCVIDRQEEKQFDVKRYPLSSLFLLSEFV